MSLESGIVGYFTEKPQVEPDEAWQGGFDTPENPVFAPAREEVEGLPGWPLFI